LPKRSDDSLDISFFPKSEEERRHNTDKVLMANRVFFFMVT